MDPLSATLAVVTLATTVKDIVELGQRIHDSFSKVTNNLRRAQRMAEDIHEMVEEIRTFCEENKEALENMKDFCWAVHGLLGKLRLFETSILPLLPHVRGGKRDRLVRGWDAWLNNNKIEGGLLDLRNGIVKVMRKFMMKSAMRTEVKLEKIHRETSNSLTGITHSLKAIERVHRDVSALRTTAAAARTCSYDPPWRTSEELNYNIMMFAKTTQQTSTPMLRTPDVITEELMTTAYIKLQVDIIVTTLEKLSTLLKCTSISSENFIFLPILELASMNIVHLRHHVVRKLIDIRDLLDTKRNDTISMHVGGHALNELSSGLEYLGMDHESILVGKWAINLARTVVDGSSAKKHVPAAILALYLLNQSARYVSSGDKIQGLQTIKEAYTIIQSLRNQNNTDTHLHVLYSDILLQYSELVENQQSIEMSAEAVHILQDTLRVQEFSPSGSYGTIESAVQPGSPFIRHIFSSTPPITAIISYGQALQSLGVYLSLDGQHQSAINLVLLAIAVHREMVSIHGYQHGVYLARALLSLLQDHALSYIPTEERVNVTETCIQIFRQLAETNPMYYSRQLVFALLANGSALAVLGRDIKAIAAWEEAASLASQILRDSELCAAALSDLSTQFRRLKRHDDTVRTATMAITMYHKQDEIQAWRYFHVSRDLQQLRRYKESAEAAQTSVRLYRHLAMGDPRTWMGDVAEGLADLALSLAALDDYSGVLIAWKETVSILERFLDTYTDASTNIIERYCAALTTHRHISYVLKNKEECLEVSSTTVQHLRRLLERYPQNADISRDLLWAAEYSHTYSLLSFGCLQDARQYIDDWCKSWSSTLKGYIKFKPPSWKAAMILLGAVALDAQGFTEQALLDTKKAHNIVMASQPGIFKMIETMHLESRLHGSLGDSREALAVAERAADIAQDNTLQPIMFGLVWSLHAVAVAALLHGDYRRAAEAARGGCNILNSPEGLEFDENSEFCSFLRPSMFALLSFAEVNLGRCSTALAYAHCAVNASLDMRENRLHISHATSEHSFMETRGNLADILVTTGDFVQARQICQERKAYFSQRVKTRMGEYRDLAPILRMLAILCCSEGSHDEGDDAAQGLRCIIETLGTASPSLQEQVKIRLRYQAQFPVLKVLDDMYQSLNCGHQQELGSLIRI